MNLIEESLSEMIFQRNEPWKFDEITVSGKALVVLLEINGEKNLRTISHSIGIPVGQLLDAVNDLGRLNLICIYGDNTSFTELSSDETICWHARPGNEKVQMQYRGVSY